MQQQGGSLVDAADALHRRAANAVLPLHEMQALLERILTINENHISMHKIQ
jgi:protein-tyrosine phosphatase